MPPNENPDHEDFMQELGMRVLSARPGDVICFTLGPAVTSDQRDELQDILNQILESRRDVAVAIFPRNVVEEARNLSLPDLLELRDHIDEMVDNKAKLQSVGEA